MRCKYMAPIKPHAFDQRDRRVAGRYARHARGEDACAHTRRWDRITPVLQAVSVCSRHLRKLKS